MKKLLTFVLFVFLSSCSKDKTIYLKAVNGEGLTKESILSLNGIEIGTIDNIELTDQGEILIKSSIKDEINIPGDTEFKIISPGIVSPKAIALKLGKSKKMISEKDTIILKAESEDPVASDLKNLAKELSGADKNDSILKELRRLNENLEKLQTEKK